MDYLLLQQTDPLKKPTFQRHFNETPTYAELASVNQRFWHKCMGLNRYKRAL